MAFTDRPKMAPDVFVIIFCTLFNIASCTNVCDKKPELPYLDSAMFLNQSCYFTVANATTHATVTEWGLFRYETIFNATFARGVCALHGATLPIINSESENQFVASYDAKEFVDEYGENIVFRVFLGMEREPSGEYQWNDGTPVTYEPSQGWERKNSPYNHCVTLRRRVDSPIWQSVPCHGFAMTGLGVICKKVINPDCQYAAYSSIGCEWDNADKKCYTNMSVLVYAPPAKGGKSCPKFVKRECACKGNAPQRDEDVSGTVCLGTVNEEDGKGKKCSMQANEDSAADKKENTATDLRFGQVMLLVVFITFKTTI